MDTMGVGGVDDAPAWRIGPVGIENIGARQAAGRQWRGGGPVRCGVDYSVCHTAFYRSAVVAARHDFLSVVASFAKADTPGPPPAQPFRPHPHSPPPPPHPPPPPPPPPPHPPRPLPLPPPPPLPPPHPPPPPP